LDNKYIVNPISNKNIYKLKSFSLCLKMKLPKFIEFKGFLTLNILHLIKKNKVCGDDIAEIIGSKKGNKLTPGTIYPALKYLRQNKLIVYKQNGRKKIYSLTKRGDKEYKITKRIFKKMFKEMI